jgi:hypothetical protein
MEYEEPIKGIEIEWKFKGNTYAMDTYFKEKLRNLLQETIDKFNMEELESLEYIKVTLPKDIQAWRNIREKITTK